MAKGTKVIHVIHHWVQLGILIRMEILLKALPNQILNRKAIITKQSYMLSKMNPLMSTKYILQLQRP